MKQAVNHNFETSLELMLFSEHHEYTLR